MSIAFKKKIERMEMFLSTPCFRKIFPSMATTRKYPTVDIKKLYGKAAARCSFADCRKELIIEDGVSKEKSQIGNIAHIIAHSSEGPRGDSLFPTEKLDCYENWILLCPSCHKKVDDMPLAFGVDRLKEIKNEHENWVLDRLSESISKITFAELEIAAKAISKNSNNHDSDFRVISPEEKIQKNNLIEARILITMGLSLGYEVERFLANMAVIDQDYPERLKNGFKSKYLELKKSCTGDALFFSMQEFATEGLNKENHKAASIAILVYLFHICEIFEK